MKSCLPKVIAICGPTASGKTDLGIAMAKKFNGEIICADSRTVYRGMDIGTAKPIRKGQKQKMDRHGNAYYTIQGVRHYLLDVASPDEDYSVADFKEDALEIIADIHQRGKLSFLVGGSGLYIKAVVDNLQFPTETARRPEIRRKLEDALIQKGLPYLCKTLFRKDPACKAFIDERNPRRVIRALEVILSTGKKFSEQRITGLPLFEVLQIGISVDRKKLAQRIDARVEKMIEAGFLAEVRRIEKQYGCGAPAVTGIGYRQLCLYLEKVLTIDKAIANFKKGDLAYAKRQMTWFKKDKRIKWIKNDPRKAEAVIRKFLKSR